MPWITFHGTFQRFIAQDGKYLFHKPIIQFVIVLDEVTYYIPPITFVTIVEMQFCWRFSV